MYFSLVAVEYGAIFFSSSSSFVHSNSFDEAKYGKKRKRSKNILFHAPKVPILLYDGFDATDPTNDELKQTAVPYFNSPVTIKRLCTQNSTMETYKSANVGRRCEKNIRSAMSNAHFGVFVISILAEEEERKHIKKLARIKQANID